MRTIEIDFDIHKMIEAERASFDEAPNDALRRLLKLPEKAPMPTNPVSGLGQSKRSWKGEGVVLEHGTKLRMVYGRPKRTYSGFISDGDWIVEGKTFDTPSGAASGVAITGKGKKTRLNGWELWEVQRPGQSAWVRLDTLRADAGGKHVTSLKDLGLA